MTPKSYEESDATTQYMSWNTSIAAMAGTPCCISTILSGNQKDNRVVWIGQVETCEKCGRQFILTVEHGCFPAWKEFKQPQTSYIKKELNRLTKKIKETMLKDAEKLKIAEEVLNRYRLILSNGMIDPFVYDHGTVYSSPQVSGVEFFVRCSYAMGTDYIPKLQELFPNYTFEQMHRPNWNYLKREYGEVNYRAYNTGNDWLVVTRESHPDNVAFIKKTAEEYVSVQPRANATALDRSIEVQQAESIIRFTLNKQANQTKNNNDL